LSLTTGFMQFDTYFRASSYAMIAAGALALVASGGIGPALALLCALGLAAAWKMEKGRWRLSERLGLVIVLASLPLFYLDWQFLYSTGLPPEKVGVTALAHLILFLSAVKLAQNKSDRDWVFLYLISFFEVLLAAGLSVSPLFFVTLVGYVLCALNTIIAFEIQKAQRAVTVTETRLLAPPDAKPSPRLARHAKRGPARRLPFVAALLLGLILLLATPLFFVMPRTSSATFTRTSGGLSGFTGFSDTVRLGDVGRLQQSDEVVMRVRVENPPARSLRWRGVALDEFNGRVWRRSRLVNTQPQPRREGDFYAINSGPRQSAAVTTQTFYVEPLDTPVIFAAPRVIGAQGSAATLPFLRVDTEGGLVSRAHDAERVSYRIFSDTYEPDAAQLQDEQPLYSPEFRRYTALPETLDPRIAQLTRRVLDEARPRSMREAVGAVEKHLQTAYGYSLEMKAEGDEPLADFLFNVKQGHCEYFASAMVVMLRTQGIAARLVNGFQTGEYNSASDAYTVTQRDAHSWVEVYFPKREAWVTFDPTPAAGLQARGGAGLVARLGKYGEALEMLWIQYVVAYDKNEQRSLTSNVVRRFETARGSLNGFYEAAVKTIKNWYEAFRNTSRDTGEKAATRFRVLLGAALVALFGSLFLLFLRRAYRNGWLRFLLFWRKRKPSASIVEFYERMTKALARQGLKRADHETPQEFALATGMPLPVKITDAYHRVRYGGQELPRHEADAIENWLKEMEDNGR
jgi:transglutaminase-like putative cysteine protease